MNNPLELVGCQIISGSISTFTANPNEKAMEYLIILMIMFVAACLQGISGFGSGLIAVPLLVLWLPLSTLTPLLSVVNLAMALYLGWLLRHAIAWRQWPWLLGCGVLGSLAGQYLLAAINLQLLQQIMAGGVILVALLFWFNLRWQSNGAAWQQILAGTIGGFSNGALTLGGPPVVLFLTSYGLARVSFRATLTLFFLLLALTNVIGFSWQQRYQLEQWPILFCLLAGAVSGSWLGHRISSRLSESLFRKLSLVIVMIAGVVAFWGSF